MPWQYFLLAFFTGNDKQIGAPADPQPCGSSGVSLCVAAKSQNNQSPGEKTRAGGARGLPEVWEKGSKLK